MLKKFVGIIILILTIALIVIMVKSKKRPNFEQKQESQELKLITENISPIQDNIIITANGNVNAKWQSELKSEVSGPITFISDNLLVGAAFNKGDILLKVEAINYRSQLSRQKANLALAQEQLLEEEIRSQRALNDWKSLNSNKPANDYTLRKPQLNTAKMSLQAAEADLLVAENNLAKTSIRAPYDGFVVSRNVDLGETIQTGTIVAEISSSEDLELMLPLKNNQIEMILNSKEKNIQVFEINNPDKYWLAQFSRVEQAIDQKSRWRSLFLSINQKDNPHNSLPIQGSFLQAEITLNLDIKFLKIDEKSLSMQGEIWIVGKDSLLQKLKPSIAFRNNGNIFLYPQDSFNYPIELVSTPSTTLLEGMKVSQQKLNGKSYQNQINAQSQEQNNEQ